LPQPRIQEFSRFSIEGTPVSKRKIRPLIESGKISGWDDIRLSTLAALRHRGIIPETIREVTREIGMSVAQPVIDWSIILRINRRLVDPMANRYYYVNQPVQLTIKGAKPTKANIPLHPDFTERGIRTINVKDSIYIDGKDAAQLERGTIFRLKHLYNVEVKRKTTQGLDCVYAGNDVSQAALKIQWVTDEKQPVQLRTPNVLFSKGKLNKKSLQIEEGEGEIALQSLPQGTIIQLERKGFGYIEQSGDRIIINMTS
jgi:glutamyl-tRNA synthetase